MKDGVNDGDEESLSDEQRRIAEVVLAEAVEEIEAEVQGCATFEASSSMDAEAQRGVASIEGADVAFAPSEEGVFNPLESRESHLDERTENSKDVGKDNEVVSSECLKQGSREEHSGGV